MRALISMIFFSLISCDVKQTNDGGLLESKTEHDNYIPENIDNDDSTAIIQTVKNYRAANWNSFNDYSRMYKISNDQVQVFVERVFYSPDRQKIITWVGEKMLNAGTINKYSNDEKSNRICPLAGDTVFHFTVLMGYKNSSDHWQLYPWGNRQVPCCNSVKEGLAELEKYYFKDIKTDYVEVVNQSGDDKGKIVNASYAYSIIDHNFWTKSPVWKLDTVGSKGLYPFEVKTYGGGAVNKCFDCATPIILPK